MGTVCPDNGFLFGNSSCACDPGYYLQPQTRQCILYAPNTGGFPEGGSSGLNNVSVSYLLREYVTANRVTAVQTWVLVATTILAGLWLALCFLTRKAPLKDGRSAWFRWRYWISRLDFAFANHHWLEDQKAQVKRSTELGGAFSVAAWIFFLGLISSLVYEFAAERKSINQTLRTANVEEVASFYNDIEINITAVSSMSCAQLRGLDSLVEGTPGSVGMRRSALSDFANATCYNASVGPMVQLSCQSCYLDRDRYYVPWYFVDAPGTPASAVGFEFAVLASSSSGRRRTSFVSGELSAGSNRTGIVFGTIRGQLESVLDFAFFPRIDKDEKWRLMEASFHQYVPGTIFTSSDMLQASYENPADGFLNVTIHLDMQSSFLIETSAPTSLGPGEVLSSVSMFCPHCRVFRHSDEAQVHVTVIVTFECKIISLLENVDAATFLSRLGGLYTISICLFYVLMREFEYRVKLLRFDDKILNKMLAREKARLRWGKVRLFVKYRARRDAKDDKVVGKSSEKGDNFQQKMIKTLSKIGSSTKRAFKNQPPETLATSIPGLNEEKVDSLKVDISSRQQHMSPPDAGDIEAEGPVIVSSLINNDVPPGTGGENSVAHLHSEGDLEGRSSSKAQRFVLQFRSPAWSLIKEPLPPVPDLNFGEHEDAGNQMDVGGLQQKLRQLHEWNTRLRADLLNTQRVLDEVIRLFRPHKDF